MESHQYTEDEILKLLEAKPGYENPGRFHDYSASDLVEAWQAGYDQALIDTAID